MRRACFAVIVCLAATASGCKGKATGDAAISCDRVATQVANLAKADLHTSTAPAAEQSRAGAEIGPLHDVTAAICTERKWAPEVRQCMVGATSGTAMAACAAALPATDRTPVTR